MDQLKQLMSLNEGRSSERLRVRTPLCRHMWQPRQSCCSQPPAAALQACKQCVAAENVGCYVLPGALAEDGTKRQAPGSATLAGTDGSGPHHHIRPHCIACLSKQGQC